MNPESLEILKLVFAILGSLVLSIPGFLAFIRGLKTDKIDGATKITDSALKIVSTAEIRLDELEIQNKELQKINSEMETWKNNIILELQQHRLNSEANKRRIAELEKELESLVDIRDQLAAQVQSLEAQIVVLQDERAQVIEDNRVLLERLSILEKQQNSK
jgi:chromosome segregation ATPase